MILADFMCPVHGRFEMLVDANADTALCPAPNALAAWLVEDLAHLAVHGPVRQVCGIASPWTPSPVAGRVRLVEVSRGKVEPPPTPQHYNTEKLGEGQRYSEWRAERKAMWREHDRKVRKERAG